LKPIDYIFFGFIAISALIAVFSFAVIEKYLIKHALVNRQASHPNVLEFFKKYIDSTKRRIGRIGWWLWLHAGAAGIFILLCVAYVILRFSSYVLSYLPF